MNNANRPAGNAEDQIGSSSSRVGTDSFLERASEGRSDRESNNLINIRATKKATKGKDKQELTSETQTDKT